MRHAAAVAGAIALTIGPATAAVGAADGVADPSPTDQPAVVVLGLPPATTETSVAPVVGWHAPVLEMVAAPLEMIRRTAAVDGAVGHDAATEREVFTLAGDVFFEFDSADLTERARTELEEIASRLADAEPSAVAVVGHTDTQGSDSYNDELSLARATTVREALAASAPGVELTAEGRGEREPLADEAGTPEEVERARALNRRVTVELALRPDRD